jgi:hypothetical protein
MSRLSLALMFVVGLGMAGAAGQDYGSGAPRGYPHYNNGYGPQQAQGWPPNQNDNRRYTTVTVTNRGQNGNRDEVVQQTVQCGSTYYDGYRNRVARC